MKRIFGALCVLSLLAVGISACTPADSGPKKVINAYTKYLLKGDFDGIASISTKNISAYTSGSKYQQAARSLIASGDTARVTSISSIKMAGKAASATVHMKADVPISLRVWLKESSDSEWLISKTQYPDSVKKHYPGLEAQPNGLWELYNNAELNGTYHYGDVAIPAVNGNNNSMIFVPAGKYTWTMSSPEGLFANISMSSTDISTDYKFTSKVSDLAKQFISEQFGKEFASDSTCTSGFERPGVSDCPPLTQGGRTSSEDTAKAFVFMPYGIMNLWPDWDNHVHAITGPVVRVSPSATCAPIGVSVQSGNRGIKVSCNGFQAYGLATYSSDDVLAALDGGVPKWYDLTTAPTVFAVYPDVNSSPNHVIWLPGSAKDESNSSTDYSIEFSTATAATLAAQQ